MDPKLGIKLAISQKTNNGTTGIVESLLWIITHRRHVCVRYCGKNVQYKYILYVYSTHIYMR